MTTSLRLIPLLLLLSLLSTGCALFGAPEVHKAGLVSKSSTYHLTSEQLAATPMLNEELRGVRYDDQGRMIAAESVSRSWGIPPAPQSMYFAASETMADTATTLSQNANWTGIGVTSDRTQTGNADTARIGADAFVAAAQIQGDALGQITEGAVRGALGWQAEQQATERYKIGVEGDVRKAEIAAEPRHEAPAAVDPGAETP